MDQGLGLESATKQTAFDRHCAKLHNMECLFFVGVKTDSDNNATLVFPVRSTRGERIHKAGSVTAQNAAFAEAINDTMATLYTTDTHFLCRATDLHSSNFTNLQITL